MKDIQNCCFIYENFQRFLKNLCASIFVWICLWTMYIQCWWRPESDIGYPDNGHNKWLTPPLCGCWERTRVLWKSSLCSQLLSYCSRPWFLFYIRVEDCSKHRVLIWDQGCLKVKLQHSKSCLNSWKYFVLTLKKITRLTGDRKAQGDRGCENKRRRETIKPNLIWKFA